MRKLTSLLLAVVMLLAGVALADFDAAANTFPIADEKIPLTVTIYGVRTEIEDWETNFVCNYWEEKLGLDITWIPVPSATADEKIMADFASDNISDVIFGGLNKDTAVAYGAQGKLLPLNDLIKEWGVNIAAIQEEHPEYIPSITSPDGNIYFLAEIREMDANHTAAPGKLLINTKWLENVGKEVPTTADELYEVLVAFKEEDANGNGDPDDEIPLYATGFNRVGSYIMQAFTYMGFNGVNPNYFFFDDDGSINVSYATEGWKEGLAFLNKLYSEGLYDPECFIADASAAKKLTGAETGNRIGCAESYSYSGLMNLTDVDLCNEFEFIEPLYNADGVRVTAANSITMIPMFFVSAKCSNPEAAIRLADAMLVDPFANDMAGLNGIYGPEGEGWARAAEGETNAIGEPALYKWLFTWGQPNNINVHENFMENYVAELKGGMAATVTPNAYNQEAALLGATVELYIPYAQYRTVSPMVMFTESEVNEVSAVKTEIETFVEEATTKFITGELNVENDWDKYLENLETYRLSWLLEMYETAYDRQFGK